MIYRSLLLHMLACGALAAAAQPVQAQDEGERAFALAREVERLAAAEALWPGFDPLTVPLAVFDGRRTYLFRHPAPPEVFTAAGRATPAAYVHEGRHPAVTANTHAEIGDLLVATVLLDASPPGRSFTERELRDLAAVALHEAFHVYQRLRHPGWQANEADLFVYPFENVDLLALRRLEDEALRRALAASASADAACWARQALALRHERFAQMDSAFAAYERGTELNEGLAAYVEARAAGRTAEDLLEALPPEGFAPAAVRHRAYVTGPALALLLDRFAPGWARAFEADDRQYLDAALADALEEGGTCRFTEAEVAAAERAAHEGAALFTAEQAERRASFEAQPGWRVVVVAAEGQPLWPQGFDPLNVHRVEGGVLHTRFLRLGNGAGQLEAMNAVALTEAAGSHPLFDGLRRVVLTGLAEPEVRTEDGTVTVRTPGLTAAFNAARVRRTAAEVVVQLHPEE